MSLFVAAWCIRSSTAEAAATEPRGLAAITGFERLPDLKADTMAAGQSSFDRTGGNGDFSNFLYTEGDEKVLLDLTGPGTVYRIWFTGFDRSKDYLKVYFDGETTPRINLLLRDIFCGTNAPFLAPLVGDDAVSSGGFYCYLPLTFRHSIKITSNGTSRSFYYNIGYHIYSGDTTSVTTWSGNEDSSAARKLWKNAGADPKSEAGTTTISKSFELPAGASQTLLDVAGPREISALKLSIPGMEPPPRPPSVTDDGRAHKGFSQFQMTVDPANGGAVLVRRLDYAIANQKADVYVDDTLAGQWFDAGSNGSYNWRDSRFEIPPAFTASKSSITVKVVFVGGNLDWNEFRYWMYSSVNGNTNLTDTLDVGNAASESAHQYHIDNETWNGTRTFEYPPAAPAPDTADLLANLWLRISFDGEANPSVLGPVGSFFAMGQFAAYFTRALPVGMDKKRNLYCYFPMPFARHATVELVSRRQTGTANIQCQISHQKFKGSFANVGCFKTAFNSELPTKPGTDITFLDVEGAGHLVGVVENMMGPTSRGYLEGDERFYIDDSQSPSFYGTGTEDFYNSGWYFNHGLYTLPSNGNPAHVADSQYDRTTAYRLFMQDAIPFRKHIHAGIEHGDRDSVSENTWTLAYYYYQPAPRAELTDELDVGNAASETAHAYKIEGQTWVGSRTNTYDGNADTVEITDDGRAHKSSSQFKLALAPHNAGAILRRRFDQSVSNQRANVYVDGKLLGEWYRAGGNKFHQWRDDDFMIPARYTKGKSSIQIKVQFVSSSDDWNEFRYTLYTLKPSAAN